MIHFRFVKKKMITGTSAGKGSSLPKIQVDVAQAWPESIPMTPALT
jgi:hypothetical protein